MENKKCLKPPTSGHFNLFHQHGDNLMCFMFFFADLLYTFVLELGELWFITADLGVVVQLRMGMNGGRKHAKITHITLDYKTKSLLYIILKKTR